MLTIHVDLHMTQKQKPNQRHEKAAASQILDFLGFSDGFSGLLKRYILQPFDGFFNTNIKGHHHLQGNVQVYNVRIPVSFPFFPFGGRNLSTSARWLLAPKRGAWPERAHRPGDQERGPMESEGLLDQTKTRLGYIYIYIPLLLLFFGGG